MIMFRIEQVFAQTENGIKEVCWISPVERPHGKLFPSKQAAIDYLNSEFDEDYEPEEPNYDN